MTEKLTPWFPGDVKPVRMGAYMRKYEDGMTVYCKWNGLCWLCAASTARNAANETVPSGWQSLPWRGLAQDPAKEEA